MSKKVTKYVRFGYYTASLNFDFNKIKRQIKRINTKIKDKSQKCCEEELKKQLNVYSELQERAYNHKGIVDLNLLLMCIKNNSVKLNHKIKNKLIDIDITTYIEDDETIFVEFANNREDSLDKKKLGGKRETIKLDDDEYIGEFIGILYYKKVNCVMIQYNKYSVSLNDLGIFLTHMWQENFYKELNIMIDEEKIFLPVMIELNPIMCSEKLNELKECTTFESIKINSTSIALRNLIENSEVNSPLFNLQKALEEFHGFRISFEIKANIKKDKDKKLNEDQIVNILKPYLKYKDSELENNDENKKMEMPNISTKFVNDDDIKETLTWSAPILDRTISISFDKRSPITFQGLYKYMKEGLKKDEKVLLEKLN